MLKPAQFRSSQRLRVHSSWPPEEELLSSRVGPPCAPFSWRQWLKYGITNILYLCEVNSIPRGEYYRASQHSGSGRHRRIKTWRQPGDERRLALQGTAFGPNLTHCTRSIITWQMLSCSGAPVHVRTPDKLAELQISDGLRATTEAGPRDICPIASLFSKTRKLRICVMIAPLNRSSEKIHGWKTWLVDSNRVRVVLSRRVRYLLLFDSKQTRDLQIY